ncbi:MAG: carbon-nitrogen hydrolase family protein [Legionellales bacterium]|nr:carbon-nitrogen hydrolase family protein [Legionellales bacterium]
MQTVAAIQMCSTNDLHENLAQAADLTAQAVDAGARLIVLPEMFAILGCQLADKISHQEAPGSGKMQDFLAELAAKHKIWVVGGTIPLTGHTPGKARAACLVFSENGQQVARYDKINLFDANLSQKEAYCESASTEPGDTITLLDSPVGKLGLCVCFDMRFPNIFTELSMRGAEVIAIPAAFAVKTGQAHWELLVRCRALDTQAYVIAAGQSGQHPNGRNTYGHSMIVNPWGDIISEQITQGPGVVSATIDLEWLHEIRRQLPVVRNTSS